MWHKANCADSRNIDVYPTRALVNKSWETVKKGACSNNLVNALRLVLRDPWPALSLTLEGLQSWVVKGATQASGWERVYGYLEPHLKLWGGGKGEFIFPAVSIALCLQFRRRQQPSSSSSHILKTNMWNRSVPASVVDSGLHWVWNSSAGEV